MTTGNSVNNTITGTAGSANAINSATTTVNVSSATAPTSGQVLTATSGTAATWQTPTTGTVTAVSVASANGFAGSSSGGATPALTISTSITGVLLGNGTAISASNVTNDAQTKAAIVPNTAPSAGQILVGNAGGTAYAPATVSGAITLASTGAATIATPGTLTVSTSNSTATAHTHAITSSSAPGAAASILATDSSGIIGSTGTRIVKIWATDLTVTNAIAGSITGNAATVTTNANLTGDVTSSGNVTTAVNVGGVPIVGTTTTQTLSNKRLKLRFVATTQSATPTINTDNTDIASITGLAQAITSMTTNLSGTPNAGDLLMIQITDNGTARAITWGASFASTTVTLPTTTVISTLLRVGFQWDTVAAKWQCIAAA